MTIRVGCVPEHFSAPLLYALDHGGFKDCEIELVICKFGTGDMVKRLVAGELDVAICVTEGLIAGIANNKDADLRLFGTYVESALPWAVSVAQDSKFSTLDDLAFGAIFGISRIGSGSEVMARYASSAYEWKAPRFEVLGDIDGLVRGVQEKRVDAFLWERTTMQRHYDRNEVRYLGTVRPPWPAFSFGAREHFIRENSQLLCKFREAVSCAVQKFMEMEEKQRLTFVCEKLGYSQEDVRNWAAYVCFSKDMAVDQKRVERVSAALHRAGVVAEKLAFEDVVMTP
ncbi:hypothetical protein H4S08_002337 [Coemansia sp. RSA 1365]|nr:hypothetical protein H4S08_002337 [Coemansia sp. RSA 1365]